MKKDHQTNETSKVLFKGVPTPTDTSACLVVTAAGLLLDWIQSTKDASEENRIPGPQQTWAIAGDTSASFGVLRLLIPSVLWSNFWSLLFFSLWVLLASGPPKRTALASFTDDREVIHPNPFAIIINFNFILAREFDFDLTAGLEAAPALSREQILLATDALLGGPWSSWFLHPRIALHPDRSDSIEAGDILKHMEGSKLKKWSGHLNSGINKKRKIYSLKHRRRHLMDRYALYPYGPKDPSTSSSFGIQLVEINVWKDIHVSGSHEKSRSIPCSFNYQMESICTLKSDLLDHILWYFTNRIQVAV